MNGNQRFWWVALGVLLGVVAGLVVEHGLRVTPVQAQTFVGGEAACMTKIPPEWGEFKGASAYGLAFEDGNGRLRFIKQPACSSNFYSDAAQKPVIDLILDRK